MEIYAERLNSANAERRIYGAIEKLLQQQAGYPTLPSRQRSLTPDEQLSSNRLSWRQYAKSISPTPSRSPTPEQRRQKSKKKSKAKCVAASEPQRGGKVPTVNQKRQRGSLPPNGVGKARSRHSNPSLHLMITRSKYKRSPLGYKLFHLEAPPSIEEIKETDDQEINKF